MSLSLLLRFCLELAYLLLICAMFLFLSGLMGFKSDCVGVVVGSSFV